jgi:hypothetical protein
MKVEHAGYAGACPGAYPKKKKSVAGQFAAVKYRSETYRCTEKLNREDYGVDKYWVIPLFYLAV